MAQLRHLAGRFGALAGVTVLLASLLGLQSPGTAVADTPSPAPPPQSGQPSADAPAAAAGTTSRAVSPRATSLAASPRATSLAASPRATPLAASPRAANGVRLSPSPGCSYADEGTGAYARSLCWINLDGFTTRYNLVTDPQTTGVSCRPQFFGWACRTTGRAISVLGQEYGDWSLTTSDHTNFNRSVATQAAIADFESKLAADRSIFRSSIDGSYWGSVTGVPVSVQLADSLTLTAKISSTLDAQAADKRGLALEAAKIPTGTWAGLGNNGIYTGISGKPALMMPGSQETHVNTITNVTLSDVRLTRTGSSTPIVDGFSIVAADAEVTTGYESIRWSASNGKGFRWLPNNPQAFAAATNNQQRKDAAVGSNSCNSTPLSQFGPGSDTTPAATLECIDNLPGSPRNGSAMVQVSPASAAPFAVTQRMQGGGTQGVAFGVLTTGAQIDVRVQDRIVDTAGAPTATNFRARLDPNTASFTAADGVVSETGSTPLAGPHKDLRVPATDQGFEFRYSETTPNDAYLDSYQKNWVCSKSSATSSKMIPWSGNGTPKNPQPSPPPASWSTLRAGEFAQCTLTFIPPYLTLTKTLENNGGGSATPDQWTLSAASERSAVTGKTGEAAVTRVPVAVGAYTVTESGGPSGYRWRGISCGTPTVDARGNIVSATVNVTKNSTQNCALTNTFTRAKLTLVHELSNRFGGTATARDWTLTASGPTPGVTGKTGDPAVTNVSVEAGSYTLSSGEPRPGYTSTWSCVNGSTELPVSSKNTVTVPEAGAVTCTLKSTDVAGAASWKKVDEAGALLGGSQWTLKGPGLPAEGVVIRDCVSGACLGDGADPGAAAAVADRDGTPGAFRLDNLRWGSYTLVETRAPDGFLRDTTERRFEIGPNGPAQTFDAALGSIVNVRLVTPTVPLTGGMSTLGFVLAGGGLAAAVALGLTVQQTRRRRHTE